jgi:hypothetical protein
MMVTNKDIIKNFNYKAFIILNFSAPKKFYNVLILLKIFIRSKYYNNTISNFK